MTVPISIRKVESDAVLAILAERGFEDVDKKDADAVLKVAMNAVLERDWYVAAVKMSDDVLMYYGPFATEGAAYSALVGNGLGVLRGSRRGVFRLDSAKRRIEYVEEQ